MFKIHTRAPNTSQALLLLGFLALAGGKDHALAGSVFTSPEVASAILGQWRRAPLGQDETFAVPIVACSICIGVCATDFLLASIEIDRSVNELEGWLSNQTPKVMSDDKFPPRIFAGTDVADYDRPYTRSD